MALALYRRYRPDTFDGVIGQDQVTVPLMRALDENKLTHAYLFSGPRGCGKTSSARILARCVNCAKGPTSHPCGECASCRDLATGGPGSIDVVEIDAASHNGVDEKGNSWYFYAIDLAGWAIGVEHLERYDYIGSVLYRERMDREMAERQKEREKEKLTENEFN